MGVVAAALALGAGAAPSAFADDGVTLPAMPVPVTVPAVVVPVPVLPPVPTVAIAPMTTAPVTRAAQQPSVSAAIPPMVSLVQSAGGPPPAPTEAPVEPVPAPAGNAAPASVPAAPPPAPAAPAPEPPPPSGLAADTSGNTVGENSSGITSTAPKTDSVTPPGVWIWNWSWNCDPSSAPVVPSPPAGSTVWIWDWQWQCPGGAPGPAPAVPSVCVQCNVAVSIRIASPGDDGAVTQSNLAAASATAANAASAALTAAQLVAQSAGAPPLPPFSMPPIPLPPAPELNPVPAVDVQRELAGVVPALPSAPAPALLGDEQASPWRGADTPGARRRPALAGHAAVHSRALAPVESRAFAGVVVGGRSRSGGRAHPAATAPASGAASPSLPSAPRAPFAPSSPAAAGTAGSSGHGGGASVLTVSLTGALTFLAFALLSSILPATPPGRRRLSDDRRARPG